MRLATEAKTRAWLTTQEVADQLRIDPETVYRLCRAGKMPGALKLGRSWRIHAETLLASLWGSSHASDSWRRRDL
jgi:excisionase family DNA binding protein